MKCFYGSAMTSPRDNHDMIEATQIGGGAGRRADEASPARS